MWPSHFDKGVPHSNHHLVVMYRANSSYSAADAITELMIFAMIKTALFIGGIGRFSERKMWAPDMLVPLDSLFKTVYECAASTISLAQKQ